MRRVFLWLLPVAALGCQPEIVPEPYVPTNAHDAYRHALSETGLIDTALGRDWLRAAETALRSPVDVATPFKETVYIDQAEAFAHGYRFSVRRGQRTEVQLSLEPTSDWRMYLDLFRVPERPEDSPVHVASGGAGDLRLAFEPRRDAKYHLRVQSELLRGGSCTIEIRSVPSLEFPVSGRDTRAIGSRFGVPREGGRRAHHGVDIFAPRHSEVLATSNARVRRVADWKLGGRVVWLEDPERNLRLYFAHLQTQDVEEGVWVQAGDRIGTVGNSGNARTTPPHLHFGVYARGEGPIDPFPFLEQPDQEPPAVRVSLEPLGTWRRIKENGVPFSLHPDGEAAKSLPAHTPVRVTGGVGRRYRVALPNGIVGYVPENATEPLSPSVDTVELIETTRVLDRPAFDAATVRHLESRASVDVLARYGSFLWVDSDVGRPSWIHAPDPWPAATAP